MNAKPLEFEGVTYPSLTAAAIAMGVPPNVAQARRQRGLALEQVLSPYLGKTIAVKGEIMSVSQAAKRYGIEVRTLRARLRTGMSPDEAVTKEPRSCFYAEKKAPYTQRLRALIAKLKDRPCADCGQRYPPYVMDFDHRPGSGKQCLVSKARTFKRLIEEAKKCDVVCSNCHRIRTFLTRRILGTER